MAISTVTNRVQYQGNGTSAVFSFQYPFQSQSDLAAFVYNSSATAPAIVQGLQLNSGGPLGFTISGTADSQGIYRNGGNLVFNSTPNVESVIVIFRSSVVSGDFAVPERGSISSSGLTNAIDRLTLIAQRLQDQATRSVRLADGFAGSFDPTIPPGVASAPNKSLVVNSTCTGFVLSDPLGGTYIPNTVIVATGTSAVNSLGGAPAGYLLQSNGSSAPSWQQINLTPNSSAVDAGAITGVLGVQNGGTGTSTSYIQYGLVYASSATQLGSIAPGGADVPFVGNGAGAPGSYRPISLASGSSVTDVLPIPNGGTGNTSMAPTYGVVYVANPSALAVVPSAASGRFLGANGSSAPSFQALPATNLVTDTTGILPVASGGTNNSSFTQYGLVYAATATQLATVPSATSGRVLTSNGSSAPTFQPITFTPTPTIAVSSTYGASNSDQMIYANSSNYNIGLFAASGNGGRSIKIRKVSNDFGVINIVGSSITSTTLNTFGEQIEFICDGSTFTEARTIPSAWTSYSPGTQGFGSISASRFHWKRVGDSISLKGRFVAGTPSSVEGRVDLPAGLVINSGIVQTNQIAGLCATTQGNQTENVLIQPAATYIVFGRMFFNGVASSTILASNPNLFMSGGDELAFHADTIPVLGWKG